MNHEVACERNLNGRAIDARAVQMGEKINKTPVIQLARGPRGWLDPVTTSLPLPIPQPEKSIKRAGAKSYAI